MLALRLRKTTPDHRRLSVQRLASCEKRRLCRRRPEWTSRSIITLRKKSADRATAAGWVLSGLVLVGGIIPHGGCNIPGLLVVSDFVPYPRFTGTRKETSKQRRQVHQSRQIRKSHQINQSRWAINREIPGDMCTRDTPYKQLPQNLATTCISRLYRQKSKPELPIDTIILYCELLVCALLCAC